jgi:hypothetical protein
MVRLASSTVDDACSEACWSVACGQRLPLSPMTLDTPLVVPTPVGCTLLIFILRAEIGPSKFPVTAAGNGKRNQKEVFPLYACVRAKVRGVKCLVIRGAGRGKSAGANER